MKKISDTLQTNVAVIESIKYGRTALGIELGSTRIKAALIDDKADVLATGGSEWENRFEDGFWSYSLDDVWTGLQSCYAALKTDVKQKYGITLSTVGSVGISAMMHGYLVFDKDGGLLTPFRTWRNNNAESAAGELTELFKYPIPARWSIAHLYQACKDGGPHTGNIDFQTTLAGYVHWRLTGERVIGVGDASGMFPIDLGTLSYNRDMKKSFDTVLKSYKFNYSIDDIFPKVLSAGSNAGFLTAEGAKLLDASGELKAGIPFCPPEGDAGTGMTATNAVRRGTGNISAGTSIFGMVVLDKELNRVHPEIDLVTTPSGALVAMVHCNNCTSEINAWVKVFEEFSVLMGMTADKNTLFEKLFSASLDGDPACGGLTVYNYLSGENITGIDAGRPLFVRTTESSFNLSNFVRAQIYSAFATLKIGFDILSAEEVKIDSIIGHGGIFKSAGAAQKFLAAALDTPVVVTKTTNEGGAWGMALLALYTVSGAKTSLEDYLDKEIFVRVEKFSAKPDKSDVKGFEKFMEKYKRGLTIVKTAVTAFD